jgi:hypothetical protein
LSVEYQQKHTELPLHFTQIAVSQTLKCTDQSFRDVAGLLNIKMIDAIKDYLAPKRFGIVAYVCVIVHFLCGLVFTAVTAALRASENGKFSCSVDAKSTATYKKQVDQVCFARYDQAYNSPLPLYTFVLLSIGLSVVVSIIYSLLVWKRVEEIESSNERQTDGEAEHRVHGQDHGRTGQENFLSILSLFYPPCCAFVIWDNFYCCTTHIFLSQWFRFEIQL